MPMLRSAARHYIFAVQKQQEYPGQRQPYESTVGSDQGTDPAASATALLEVHAGGTTATLLGPRRTPENRQERR